MHHILRNVINTPHKSAKNCSILESMAKQWINTKKIIEKISRAFKSTTIISLDFGCTTNSHTANILALNNLTFSLSTIQIQPLA